MADVKPVKILVPMPPSLLEQIDRIWHERALMSRSATIRALLEEAIEFVPVSEQARKSMRGKLK